MTQRQIVGKAVANTSGEYVSPDGHRFNVSEGDVFDLVEGLEKSRWFTKIEDGAKPVAKKALAFDPANVPGAGPKRGSKVKVDVTGEDIA